MKIATLTDTTFGEEIGAASLPVLVDFSAEWCGPCKFLEPIIGEIAIELHDRLTVFEIDVDDNPQPAVDFGVLSFPTLILFRDGQEVRRWIGARGKRQLLAELDDMLQREVTS